MFKKNGPIGKSISFYAVNEIGPEHVIRHIADQKNNREPHHNFCNISACFHLMI
jgi:hypothetical protein